MKMKKVMAAMAIVAAVAASTVLPANAATAAFGYQGVLMNAEGTAPLTGNQTVEIRLYDMAEGGAPLWGRSYAVLLDANGLFNVEVSDASGSAIGGMPRDSLETVFRRNATTTLYIGLKVSGTSGEILPRQKMLAVPYATFASDVSRASGNFTVAGLLTAKSLTVTNGLTTKSISASGNIGAATLTTSGKMTVNGDLVVSGSINGTGAVPIGGIIMWRGTTPPSGWQLCDGSNGTPDLRGRFVVCIGGDNNYAVGDTGGVDTVALTQEQMPKHNHTVYGRSSGYAGRHNDSHEVITYYNKEWGSMSEKINDTTETGSSQAHENRPPYYALAFIMRVE